MQQEHEHNIQPLLLTVPQAARSLGISRAKLYVLLAQQQGPPVIRFGRSVRISVDSLQKWIKKQENVSL
ncbi:helix-turn-helix transcriptional regulator [Dictyobacter aurantiacus]|uniref:Helix-turn-helix domain-containing protein n=1 Tax=Dictyobacter aurantiacus TaxID=1936993 RepID=A0A401Z9H7_9CHLR|nr:helix-turn-helix domain-containing protein [Dictyobacter aurantiacus]GCE03524.1 hypothetical protein KDAU_08530 [Dictyobacter aurantiacus]